MFRVVAHYIPNFFCHAVLCDASQYYVRWKLYHSMTTKCAGAWVWVNSAYARVQETDPEQNRLNKGDREAQVRQNMEDSSALPLGHIPYELTLDHNFNRGTGVLVKPPACRDTELLHLSLLPMSNEGVHMIAIRDPNLTGGVRPSSAEKVATQEHVRMPEAKEQVQEEMLIPPDEEHGQKKPVKTR